MVAGEEFPDEESSLDDDNSTELPAIAPAQREQLARIAKLTAGPLAAHQEQMARMAKLAAGPLAAHQEQMARMAKLSAVPLAAHQEQMARIAQSIVTKGFATQYARLHSLAELAARAVRLIFPLNLRKIEGLTLAAIDAVIMDEGIPLYGVPRTETARMLIEARSSADRRAILGRRWRSISADCAQYLSQCDAPSLAEERTFALKAVAALRDGHSAAAQALAANLLDTLVTKHFKADRHVLIPSKNVRLPDGYEAFMGRKYLAVAPIWSAYMSYFVANGDPIPRVFSRHATAHSVSEAQMSRRNAVLAVLLVSSLVGYLNELYDV
jgi:hypothetical protein